MLLHGTLASAQVEGAGPRLVIGTAVLRELGASSKALLQPGLLEANAERIYVFDYGDHALKIFSNAGQLVARSGRRGGGPGEFRGVSDMQLTPAQTVIIADPQAARISWFSPEGAFQRAISTKRWVQRASPMYGDTLALFNAMDSVLVKYSGEKRIGAFRLPREDAFLDSMTVGTDRIITTLPDGSLVMAFLYSGQLGRVQAGSSALTLHRGISGARWPREEVSRTPGPNGRPMTTRRLPSDVRPLQIAVSASPEHLFVLSWAPSDASRFIDVYQLRSLQYACSFAVEGRLRDLAVTGNQLVGLVDEPEPSLASIALPSGVIRGVAEPCPRSRGARQPVQ
jgi:hypothetical protein